VLVCSRWIARIAGSNPAEGMEVRHLGVLCVVQVGTSATGRSLLEGLCVFSCAWSRILNNMAAWTRFGLWRHKKNRKNLESNEL